MTAPLTPSGPPAPRLTVASRDTVTILTMRGDLVAAKVITRAADGTLTKHAYSLAKRFHLRVARVDNLTGLYSLLLNLATRRQDFIIRGTPIADAAQPGEWRKTLHAKEDGPANIAVPDPGRYYAAFDFDAMPLDFYMSSPPTREDLERAAHRARAKLPAAFQKAACIYRFSASAGLDAETASLHLWFWFSRPIACYSLREHTKALRLDGSICSPVQPHYTANPLFIGMDDPLEGMRLGMLEGLPEVDPPADWLDLESWRAKALAEAEAAEAARPALVTLEIPQSAEGVRRWCMRALESASEDIRSQGQGGRHDSAIRNAHAMGGLVQPGALELHEVESALIAAIQASVPKDRHAKEADSVRELVALGAARPRDLSRIGRRPEPAPGAPLAPPPRPITPAAELASMLGGKPAASEAEVSAVRARCSGLDTVIDVDSAVWSAPVEGHRVPHGYWMNGFATGTWKEDKKNPDEIKCFPVAHAPVVVSAKLKDLESGTTILQVAWRAPTGDWSRASLPKENAAQASKVVALAGADFPVTSTSAGFLAKYLDDYQAANYQKIRLLETTGIFGWVRGGSRGFVWGKTHIQPDGTRVEIDVDDQDTWPANGVAFRSAEGGADAQLCKALHAAGSFDRWREAARGLYHHPRALLGILVSLSSLMLEVLDAGNFVLDWGSSSGGGKTTSAHFAMSVWGEPRRLMTAWSTTEVAVEQQLAMRGCIPMWLDDTKSLKDRTLPAKVIYLVANGRGRARGGRAGNALAVSEFRTCLISTGEQALTSFDESGGARVRTLEVTTRPIASGQAELVRRTTAIADANYGHAGPRCAAWLLERRDQWSTWRQRWKDRTAELTTQVTSDHEGRVAAIRAALEMTHELLCEQALAVGIPNPLPDVWAEITAEVATATGAERALERVQALFATEAYRFKGTKASLANLAGSRVDWLGNVSKSDDGTVAFVKEKLTDEMKRWGFAPDSIYQDWKVKGVTRCDKDRRTSQRVINGATLPCIVFTFATLGVDAEAVSAGEVPGTPEDQSHGSHVGTSPQRGTPKQNNFGDLS